MANITEKDLRPIATDLASIKTALGIGKWISGILASAVVTIGIIAFSWCYNIGVKVGRLEQADQQRGTQIVADLKAPKSQQQLQANLTTVTAQIETARAEGKRPDPSKVKPLSSVLSEVVKKNPDMPSAWNAAMQLVNYRFQPTFGNISSLPDCLHIPMTSVRSEVQGPPGPDGIPTHFPVETFPPVVQMKAAMVELKNCRLDLDDNGDFASTNAASALTDAKKRSPATNYLILELNNAFITYKGGKLLPVNEIRFKNCFFEIRPTLDLPDNRRQAITQQLLEAKENEGR